MLSAEKVLPNILVVRVNLFFRTFWDVQMIISCTFDSMTEVVLKIDVVKKIFK